jgi:hypothetical protein
MSNFPEYILCEKCGAKLYVSPNSKGAFSYQGCNCHEPDWMKTDGHIDELEAADKCEDIAPRSNDQAQRPAERKPERE